MDFPRNGDAAQLREWIAAEYNEATANAFQNWTPEQLLGAPDYMLIRNAGHDTGERLFCELNTIKATPGKVHHLFPNLFS